MNTLKSSVQKERARAVGQERDETRAWLQQEQHKMEHEREKMRAQLHQEHEGDKALQSAIRAAENKGKNWRWSVQAVKHQKVQYVSLYIYMKYKNYVN